MSNPTIGDIQPSKTTFKDGDRILVKTTSRLNGDQIKSLTRSIQKYSRAKVEVAVVNCTFMGVKKVGLDGVGEILSKREDAQKPSLKPGVFNLNCTVVPFYPG